jgi:hypothetical protein
MKTISSFIIMLIISVVFFTRGLVAQVTVEGCTGTGNGTYTSLTNTGGAFSAINGGVQSGANIVITITSDITNESGANSLNAGAWTTLMVIPSGARTISGTVNAPLINLNGADFVTFNGLNVGGNSLTISNLSKVATSGTSTIRFINDATNNTITNCTILGSASVPLGTNGGNIFISTAAAGGTGNDNITISNCNIGPAGNYLPSKLIYGNGTATSSAIANSNIVINNCNMYDFFLTSGCAAVYASNGNTDWTILNNRIYQSSERTFTSSGTMYGIYFSNSTYGNNVQITGNTIGYASSSGTGTLTLNGGSVAGAFLGISLSAMPAAENTCNINSNIISDISLTSSTGAFCGINNESVTGSNTININSNQIKNAVILTSSGDVTGIYAGGNSSTINCNANLIDNINRDAAGKFYGIKYYTPNTATFNGNTIRNLLTSSTCSTAGFYGIYSGNAAVNENIIGNNIYNLTSNSTEAQYICAVNCGTAAGTKTVKNNKIYNISAGGGARIYGINVLNGSVVEISGNDVYSISGTLYLYGIYANASASNCDIFKNRIHNLSSSNTSTLTTINGISGANAVTMNIFNNYIYDLTATASNYGYSITGLNLYSGTNVNLFYNTVYLNAVSSGTTFGSYCIYAKTTYNLDMRNNILVNLSTANGSANTCVYYREGTNLTTYSANSNNNCFYAGIPGTKNLIFFDGSSSNRCSTIAQYKSLTGLAPRDAASFSENPPFVDVSSALFDLHLQTGAFTQCESGGTPVTVPISITEDFDGNTRNESAPDVGADEGSFTASTVWLGITSNAWNTVTNWGTGTSIPSSSQNVLINKTGTYNPVISSPVTMAGLFIKENNTLTLNASQTLTVNGNFTNKGTYTDNGGTAVFSGSSLQNIGGSGQTAFNNLSVNNSSGVRLGSNISVNGNLNLINSILDLNHFNIALGTTGMLSETGTGNLIQSEMSAPYGTISASRNLNAPSGADVAGLGVRITSAANLGNTTIIRGVERKESNGNLAIARYYDISPSNNTGLNATVVYCYNPSELGGGISESNLVIFKSTDNGSTWTQIAGLLNTDNKTITVSGVNDFSIWTFGDKNAPLPVELISFTANVNARNIALNWTTTSEKNNSGFEIQKQYQISGDKYSEWKKVSFIPGKGNSNTPVNYIFEDKKLDYGKYHYRLKQIDFNGNYGYFELKSELEVGLPLKFSLSQNYPNPFNPATKIDFDLPFDCKVNIVIYDLTGREVKTLVNESRSAGFYTEQFDASVLSSGIYFYRLIAKSKDGDFAATKRMILIR